MSTDTENSFLLSNFIHMTAYPKMCINEFVRTGSRVRAVRNWVFKSREASVFIVSTMSSKVRHSDCVCNLPTEF
jgi:hypothetical protein